MEKDQDLTTPMRNENKQDNEEEVEEEAPRKAHEEKTEKEEDVEKSNEENEAEETTTTRDHDYDHDDMAEWQDIQRIQKKLDNAEHEEIETTLATFLEDLHAKLDPLPKDAQLKMLARYLKIIENKIPRLATHKQVQDLSKMVRVLVHYYKEKKMKGLNQRLNEIIQQMKAAQSRFKEEAKEGIPSTVEKKFSKLSWKVLDTYFRSNPNFLVNHHLDSFNQFLQSSIPTIFRQHNPLQYVENSPSEGAIQHPNEILLYVGGKDANKIYYGKPIIYDDKHAHLMYPNEARLRNMTYGMTIQYDVDVVMRIYDAEKKDYVVVENTIPKVYLGRFPIMLQSNGCILQGLSKEVKYELGECRQDYGGYFIIDGKEKVIVPQESFANNMIYVKENKSDNLYSHSAAVRSMAEDASKPIRTTSVHLVAPSQLTLDDTKESSNLRRPGRGYTNGQLVVTLPSVRKPIPLFIVMRALGVISDKDIIQTCLLDLEKHSHYVDLFAPSIHDASQVFDQGTALQFIASFVKNKNVNFVLHVLVNLFLPHVGETNLLDKAYYLGYMTKKLWMVYLHEEAPTDRDSFLYKRVHLSGALLTELFQEFYSLQKKSLLMSIDQEYQMEKDKGTYVTNFASILDKGKAFFQDRLVEKGFQKAFKGNWGSQPYTKRVGIVQDLNRLSWFTALCHLRKSNLPMPKGAKVVGPRKLNASQWGYFDVLDAPEGAHIGFQKHLGITATVTGGYPSTDLIEWIRTNLGVTELAHATPSYLANTTKVVVNGNWIGNVEDPLYATSFLKLHRRNGILPASTSIAFRIQQKEIFLYTDAGRLTRPIYYVYHKHMTHLKDYLYGKGNPSKKSTTAFSFIRHQHGQPVQGEELVAQFSNWVGLVSGFGDKQVQPFDLRHPQVYAPEKLYDPRVATDWQYLEEHQAVLDYLDVSEEETSLIAMNLQEVEENALAAYTHVEIDPSVILGMMGNSVIFPENNPLPRNNFSGSQSRQAVSLYHTNFHNRMDKSGVVLNYGNVPLVKSRYLDYLNQEEIPYGVNCVVAIMSYTGYNVEDAILINEGALKRGLFRTSYYTTYTGEEEVTSRGGKVATVFANVDSRADVVGIKTGFNYSKLDVFGLIREGERVDDRTVLIGKVKKTIGKDKEGNVSKVEIDESIAAKKGQLGYVDKAFVTEGEAGFRLAKVRVVEDRSPEIGDKFASRAGQKGTIGYIVPEADMPFNSQGIRPDLIINPHALPSRMTIGQLVESLLGKACALYGTYGDCTAFASKGPNTKTFGSLLQSYKHADKPGDPHFSCHDYQKDLRNLGYNSTGNELLYNGMTGEQMESEIYVGVNYYMRLKHMVQDKINSRAKGPINYLTHQSVHGRAKGGGLRMGEMERDAVVSHGMATFLKKSFLERADKFKLAICNKTGLIAIYHPEEQILLSPYVDGPMVDKFQMDVNATDSLLNTTTRFGRSFSVVEIPYAFKLFMQELQVMGIQTRLITDKNIDQVLSLSGTDNVIKLTSDTNLGEKLEKHRASLHKYVDAYRELRMAEIQKTGLSLEEKNKKKKQKRKVVATDEDTAEEKEKKDTEIEKEKEEEQEEQEQEEQEETPGEQENGKEGEETDLVAYSINDTPVEVVAEPAAENKHETTTAESLSPVRSSTQSPTPAPVAENNPIAVLQVPPPPEEEKKDEGSVGESSGGGGGGGATKSIVVDI